MTVGGAVCIGDGYLGRVLTRPNKVKRLGKQAIHMKAFGFCIISSSNLNFGDATTLIQNCMDSSVMVM